MLRDSKPNNTEALDWEELQERTATTIRLCLVDEFLYHMMELAFPREVWKKFESQYMLKSLTNKLYLMQKLYGLKMQEGADLQQHVNAFNQIISDLARLDVNVEDKDKTCILLCSYKNLVTTLTYEKDSITLEAIQIAIMSHSQGRQNAVGSL